jgi:putative ABC transport system permease protein
MKTATLLKYYGRELKVQRKKIALTIAAIAWGTLSIVLLLAFGEGMKDQVLKARKGLGEDLVIVWGGQTSIPYKGLPRGRPVRLHEEDVDLLRSRIPEILRISGEYSRWGTPITYGTETTTRHMVGVNPEYGVMRNWIPERGGRFFDPLDMENKRRVVFLGSKLKEDLFGNKPAVGEQIIIDGTPFMVIGVMKEKLQMGMYSGPDVDKAAIPLTTMRTLFAQRSYFGNLVYQPVDPVRRKHVERELYRVLSTKYQFDPSDESALSIWDVIDNAEMMTNMMLGIQIFLGVIGGLTLIVAGVGVANIMYVTIKERTREIGIKMAIGAKPSSVMSQFLIESLIIAFVGGAVGLAASAAITQALQGIEIENEGLQFLGKPTISWEIGLVTVGILGLIGVIAGLFPSRKAARINPAESLRYE